MFPQYYNATHFTAQSMREKIQFDIDYIPPPDIQLFYLLEIIRDLTIFGVYELYIPSMFPIDETVYKKLEELGYIIENNYISWRKKN